MVYLGKQGEPERNLGMEVVNRLTRDLVDAGRTVVCDNFFTSPELGQNLWQKKTYLLGTVRSNRQGLPKDFVNEELAEKKARYVYNKHQTLMKLQVRKTKSVLLYSTFPSPPCLQQESPEATDCYGSCELVYLGKQGEPESPFHPDYAPCILGSESELRVDLLGLSLQDRPSFLLCSLHFLAEQFKIKKSSKKKAQKLGLKTRKHDEIEQALVFWIKQVRNRNLSLNGELVKEKAKMITALVNIVGFEASNGWMGNSKDRNRILFKLN